jgi:chemotaxis protein methyltransferase CheR
MDSTEEIELQLLLEAIYQKYHYDFRGYSMASLKRRLRQACERFRCATISQLQDRVLHDPTVLPDLLSYLTVQVSELFRDPSYYLAIRQKVMPHLQTYPSLKFWVAGCATGEEVYSLASPRDSRGGAVRARPLRVVHRKPPPVGGQVVAFGLLHGWLWRRGVR